MTRRMTISTALVAVLGAAGGFGYRQYAAGEARPAITTGAVTRGDVVVAVDATGTLQALTTVQVGTQVSGTIKALHADFNSRVRKGQVIAELEPSLFQTQVDQARASIVRLEAEARRAVVQREDAQQKLTRARDLAARQLIPAADLETAETTARLAGAAVDSADAQVAQARAALGQNAVNLANTTIRAPIDGVVISRNVDVGQTVAASMQAPTLFVLAQDLTEMQVNASVAESDIGRIAAGQPATFTVDAYPGVVFSGTVSQVRLQPVIDSNVVSYLTTIDVPNPELKLKPGMTANVSVEVARAAGVLRVPNAALRMRPSPEQLAALGQPADDDAVAASGRPGPDDVAPAAHRPTVADADGAVWVVHEGRLARVPVAVGISDAAVTAVTAEALAEGDDVLTGIAAGAAAAPAAGANRSPLMPPARQRAGTRGRVADGR
jgi:HlyD family secretion protein